MIEAEVENRVARSIRMESMKSFVELETGKITNSRITSLLSDSIDSIRFDISFGGMFYVIINSYYGFILPFEYCYTVYWLSKLSEWVG